ncbi:MAG: hypothetical protein [Caudoviricetes sp.]|nr:MAG: hypothetical protein [Caudoviricetes sp.]
MIIYQETYIRIWQHPHLQVFHCQKWMLGDDPRSYRQSYDFKTVKECFSVEDVRDWYVKETESKCQN